MPALPDVPGVLRIDFKHSETGDPSLGNRVFFKYSGGAPSPSDLNSLAGDFPSDWGSTLANLAGVAVTLDEVVITDLTSPSASRGTWTGSQAGTRAGTGLSRNDCALLNFVIPRRYRGGKPRIYAPWGVAADLATLATWSGSFITAVHSEWTNWVALFQGHSVGTTVIGAQVNVSYYEGFASVQNPVTKRWRNIPTPRTEAAIDVIGSFALNPILGSQRRRLRA